MHRTAAAAGKHLRSLKNTLKSASTAATGTLPFCDLPEPKTRVTTLPNGLRIASEPSRHPVASIGLYINSGSIYETGASTGATCLLRNMCFRSTLNRSREQLFKEVDATGGSFGMYNSRWLTGYLFDAVKIYMPEMVELLVDAVKNAAYLDGDIMEEIHNLREGNFRVYAVDLLHSAAFAGALTKPFYPPFSSISKLNSSILKNFVAENYTAPRIVFAGSGVEHKEFVSVATPLLSDLPMAMKEEPKSSYVGGEHRQHGDEDFMFVALAFETPGGMSDENMSIAIAILQKLFGRFCIWDLVPCWMIDEGFLGSNTSFYEIYHYMYKHTGFFACFLSVFIRNIWILLKRL